MASTTTNPATTTIHPYVARNRQPKDGMIPQPGTPGGTLDPRHPKPASYKTIADISNVTSVASGPATLGRRRLGVTQRGDTANACATTTNARRSMRSTSPRANRMKPGRLVTPETRMTDEVAFEDGRHDEDEHEVGNRRDEIRKAAHAPVQPPLEPPDEQTERPTRRHDRRAPQHPDEQRDARRTRCG